MDTDLNIPQELYDSEISFLISCIWDVGFAVAIGVEPNFLESGRTDTFFEACRWLQAAACRHYPNSKFAKQHGHGLRLVEKGDET